MEVPAAIDGLGKSLLAVPSDLKVEPSVKAPEPKADFVASFLLGCGSNKLDLVDVCGTEEPNVDPVEGFPKMLGLDASLVAVKADGFAAANDANPPEFEPV